MSTTTAPASTLPAAELARLSWRFDDEAFNKGNLDVVEELIAPDFVNHDPLPGQGNDRAALGAYVPILRAAMPDLRVRNELVAVQDDIVAHVIVFEGTHTQPLGDLPPSGKPVTIRAHDFQRWRGAQMTERWSAAVTEGLG